MRTPRGGRQRLGTAAVLLAVALAGCSEAQSALDDVRAEAERIGGEVTSQVEEARQGLDDVTPDVRGGVEESLNDAQQAARDAQSALEGAGEELTDESRARLEQARDELDQAQRQLERSTEDLPEQLRGLTDEVEQRLAELREQVERALER